MARLRLGARHTALTLITAALTMAVGDRMAVSLAAPALARDHGLDAVQMGWLFSAFSWAYVLGHLPAGWLVDRFGPRRVMLVGMLCGVVFALCSARAGALGAVFALLLLLRAMTGAIQAPIGATSGSTLARWFPSAERGLAGAVFNSASYLGIGLAAPLLGWVNQHFGWERVFDVLAVTGGVLAFLWWRHYHLPDQHPGVSRVELRHIRRGGALVGHSSSTPSRSSGVSPLREVLTLARSRLFIGLLVSQYCTTAITWFFVSWFPVYLVQARHYTAVEAGAATAIPALCGWAGGLAAGGASDWLLRRTGSLNLARKLPVIVGMGLSACIAAANYVEGNSFMIGIMSLAFFGKGFGSLGWSTIGDIAPVRLIGITSSVFNAAGNIAGIVMPIGIGYLVALTGTFVVALWFVSAHGVIAALCQVAFMGQVRRL